MKIKKLIYLSIFSILFMTSCGSDDNSDAIDNDDSMGMEDPLGQLEIEREETTTTLTGGNALVWRISNASLNNNTGTIDISNNFNVLDDEFVFSGSSGNGNLEWRQGNDIAVDGADQQATLLDFYRAPVNSTYTFNVDSGSELSGLDGRFSFSVIDQTTITGRISFDNATIDVTLTIKSAADYASVPDAGLSFTNIASFEAYAQFAQQHNVGFIGSNSTNSIYIAYRNDDNPDARSRIIKYSIDANTFETRDDSFLDFFTRKLDIVNNQLILTGGQNIYTYNLSLSAEPIITPHQAGVLSRSGTATINDDIYVIGGDLDAVADPLRKINSETGALDIVATMPIPKVHAGGTFVNNNLYIFSGREAFFDDDNVTSESLIYNLDTGGFISFDLPVALSNSYAARKENLIYIVGDIQTDSDGDGFIDDFEVWAGVYNTLDNTTTEIAHDLDDGDPDTYIQQMTIFNSKMYVIFGSRTPSSNGGDNNIYEILVTDL